jgi:hypothetical protein
MMNKPLLIILMLVGLAPWSSAQVDSVYDPGLGVVLLPGYGDMRGTILVHPDNKSDTLAILRGWNLYRHPQPDSHRAFLAGFRKYDYWGLPILSFNQDSSWARVLVASQDGEIYSEGWVDLTIPNTTIRIWADYLPTQRLRLRGTLPPRFYSKPKKSAIWNIQVERHLSGQLYRYVLTPIRREGRWLLVELETPHDPCGGSDNPRKVRVWIEYLDERMRPLVMAPMMC